MQEALPLIGPCYKAAKTTERLQTPLIGILRNKGGGGSTKTFWNAWFRSGTQFKQWQQQHSQQISKDMQNKQWMQTNSVIKNEQWQQRSSSTQKVQQYAEWAVRGTGKVIGSNGSSYLDVSIMWADNTSGLPELALGLHMSCDLSLW